MKDKTMSNVAVIGLQWGDEGKGKIVDWLSERADIVVRFQGGHNAGHTLMIDGKEYRLSLLPSGIVRGNKLSVIGNGVVVSPDALLAEIEKLTKQGVEINPDKLAISYAAPILLPIHAEIDNAREELKNKDKKIGTTGRGIGPAYEDKVARRGLRMADFLSEETLEDKISALVAHHNIWLEASGFKSVDAKSMTAEIKKAGKALLPYLKDTSAMLYEAEEQSKKILFEGAQGVMLDIDYGTYPFVTSSNTMPGQVALGSGVGAKSTGFVLGIAKAYTTRVGAGPFPCEDGGGDGEKLGERGCEFGTVTGRKRRCGWFDAVMVKQACRIGGVDSIALTKLDVLDDFEVLKICTGYSLDGKKIDYFPTNSEQQSRLKPIYEEVEGWGSNTQKTQSFDDLPAKAKSYIKRLEDLTGIPITIVSTGPERIDTILLSDPFQS